MANKVKFGLKNVHVFPITDDKESGVVFGEVIKVPGAVNLSLDAEGDSNEFYADDVIYWSEFSNNGYSGDLEIALIPEDFEVKILGSMKDKNGAIVEKADAKSVPYALAFEFDGDKNKTRHIFYHVTSSRPSVEGQTKEDKTDPTTDKISLKAIPATDTKIVKAKINEGATGYDDFFTKPYVVVPNAEA